MQLSLAIHDRKIAAVLCGLTLLLVASILLSLATGAVAIPLQEVAIVLLRKLGLFSTAEVDSTHEVVLNTIRIPRIIMTLFIGGALGVSGAALQGLFRNPLVEPTLIGVSGGAATAVVAVVVFGKMLLATVPLFLYHAMMPAMAFGGGLVATFLVLKLSYQAGRTNITVLVLLGVAMNALTGALVGLAIFYADENQLRTFTFWTLGDLGGATWEKLWIGMPLLAVSIAGQLFFSGELNALALGEAEAFHMGINVERTKRMIIFFSALGVGVGVSLAGIIGFVGLVIPHLVRVLFQPDHKLVLPAAVLGGGMLLVLADVIARTIVTPAELPIGVVTAIIGAPFFMALLLNSKRKLEI
jgi:iron complex transport system permease protein